MTARPTGVDARNGPTPQCPPFTRPNPPAAYQSRSALLYTVVGVVPAGRAGGRVKTGLHIDAKGTAATRVGYTALRLMGVDKPSWGVNSNNTSREIGEILA